MNLHDLFGRQVPHSPEAEMAVIGAAVLSPAIIPEIAPTIQGEDFYDPRHDRIWTQMVRAYRENAGQIDNVLLTAMGADGKYLATLAEQCPGYTLAGHYARVVRDKARLRRLIECCAAIAQDAYQTEGEADPVLTRAMNKMVGLCRVASTDAVVQLVEVEAELIEGLGKKPPAMIPSGVGKFDREFGGIPAQGVVTVMGYPASGKTTHLMRMALNIATGRTGVARPVRIYSYEMGPDRLAGTMLSIETGLGVHGMMNTGQAPSREEYEELQRALAAHAGADISIAPRSVDAPTIYNECIAAHARRGKGVVVVDYVQDLPAFAKHANDAERISASMAYLALIARDLGWLVMVASQLDKASAKINKRPTAADGIGTSAIEQRSDFMMSVYRPYQTENIDSAGGREFYLARQRCVVLEVLKNKFGQKGAVKAAFDGSTLTLREPTNEEVLTWEA